MNTMNNKRIRRTASTATSLALLMMTSSSLYAATSVTAAQPSQLVVKPGQSASVYLRGTDLDKVRRVLVHSNRTMSRDVSVRLNGKSSKSGRRLMITARPGARFGNDYQVVLLGTDNKPVPVSTNTMRIAVVAPDTRTMARTQPALGAGTRVNEVTRKTSSERVFKPRPGDEAVQAGPDGGRSGKDVKAIKEQLDARGLADAVDLKGRGIDVPQASLTGPGDVDGRFSNNTVPGTGNGFPESWKSTDTGRGKTGDRNPRDATEINPFERDQSYIAGGMALPTRGEIGQFDDPTQHGMGSTATGEYISVGGQRYGSREDAMMSRIGARKGQLSDDGDSGQGTDDGAGAEEEPGLVDKVADAVKTGVKKAVDYGLGVVGDRFGSGPLWTVLNANTDSPEDKRNEFEGWGAFRRFSTGECSYGYGGKDACKQIGNGENDTPNPMDDINGTGVAQGGTTIRVTPGCVNAECTEESMIGRAQVTESQVYAAGRARLNQLINPGDHGGAVAVAVSLAPATPRPEGCIAADCVDPTIQ